MSGGLTYLLWSDLVGMSRVRGVPTVDFERRLESGVGWAAAGQAMTPFTDIIDNVWGPVHEVRQIPDPAARFTIPADGIHPAVDAAICDSRLGPEEEWDCCARTFLRHALADLHERTGLALRSSFEHEFLLTGDGVGPDAPFSFGAARRVQPVLLQMHECLVAAGVGVETVEPEYGIGQFEISCKPELGLRGGDSALIAREVIREVARRHGLNATFTPKPAPEAVGNGAHIHLSLADADGANVTYDADGPLGLSAVAARFAAGIMAHVHALVAVTAPAPISYHRLGPHHWSCGFSAIGLQNREAAIRIIPGVGDDAAVARGYNLEFRPSDALASPYLALGALVRAGLDGIERALPLPPPAAIDPADMSEADREAAGIRPLPTSLAAALDTLEADAIARGWFAPRLFETFVSVKRWEEAAAAAMPAQDVFARYRAAY
ncbi:MAG: glutamine synthetase family protein [Alphaproteobacteria bacterium]